MQMICDNCGSTVDHVEGPTGGGYLLVRFDDSKYWVETEDCAQALIDRMGGQFTVTHPDGSKSLEIPTRCWDAHNAQNRRAGGWSGD